MLTSVVTRRWLARGTGGSGSTLCSSCETSRFLCAVVLQGAGANAAFARDGKARAPWHVVVVVVVVVVGAVSFVALGGVAIATESPMSMHEFEDLVEASIKLFAATDR